MMDLPERKRAFAAAAIPGARKLRLSYARGAKKERSGRMMRKNWEK